jgi:hypothetical protein
MATDGDRFPIGEKKTVNVEVQGTEAVTGSRTGESQWKLRVKLPWDGRYPSTLYIPRTKDAGPPPGHYICEVERGDLKTTQDGVVKKGDYGDHYYYKCLRFGIASPEGEGQPTQPSQLAPAAADPASPHQELFPDDAAPYRPSLVPLIESAPMAADHPSKRRSIERQTCLVQALLAHMSTDGNLSMDGLLATAEVFYAWVSRAPEDDQPFSAEDLPW